MRPLTKRHWPSMDSYARFIREECPDQTDPWWGLPRQEMADLLATGDKAGAHEAEARFDAFMETALPETEGGRGEMGLSVVGGSPSVGAYLSGSPANMRRREASQVLGPIRFYIGLSVTALVEQSERRDVGVAACALAYAISMHRPVELIGHFVFKDPASDLIATVSLGMSPWNTSRVLPFLDQVGTSRQLYGWMIKRFPSWIGIKTPEEPALLGVGPEDLYLPVFMGLKGGDPVEWIKKHLRIGGKWKPTS